MELRFLHFYPDLMNLYGSYANVSVLRRYLERLGHTVVVEAILPGQEADLTGADFLYMGAGTERAQKAALADFARYGTAVRAARRGRHSHAVCRHCHGAAGPHGLRCRGDSL